MFGWFKSKKSVFSLYYYNNSTKLGIFSSRNNAIIQNHLSKIKQICKSNEAYIFQINNRSLSISWPSNSNGLAAIVKISEITD